MKVIRNTNTIYTVIKLTCVHISFICSQYKEHKTNSHVKYNSGVQVKARTPQLT